MTIKRIKQTHVSLFLNEIADWDFFCRQGELLYFLEKFLETFSREM